MIRFFSGCFCLLLLLAVNPARAEYSPGIQSRPVSGWFTNQPTADDTLRVLFMGNSYTYFWNLPQTVEAMAAEAGFPLIARQSTAGGANWQEHWRGEKNLESRKRIEEGNWDIVILQNHSLSTIRSAEAFTEYGNKFINLVRENGAAPMLYLTWAREFNPLMQDQVTKGYEELGKRAGVPVVAVGAVWEQVRNLRPDLKLYDPDGSHPSSIGTYLIACVFYRALTGNAASELPERITTTDRNGEKLYLHILSEGDAQFLQQAADNMVKEVEYE
jgi:hypothetical protein